MFKLALIVAMAGLAVLGLAAAKLNEPYRTTALGITAGFGYGVLSIAARVLTGFARSNWPVTRPPTRSLRPASSRSCSTPPPWRAAA